MDTKQDEGDRTVLFSHPVLIHFSLEQIERVLSTGCMEWTNADGR
jgi:hypothetical protein